MQSSHSVTRRRLTHRTLATALAVMLATLLLLGVAGRLLLSPDRVETALDDALGDATAGLYALSVQELDLQPVRGRVVARGLRIAPDSGELLRLVESADAPAAWASVDIGSLELRGIDRLRLLRSRRLSARDLRANGWEVSITLADEDATGGEDAGSHVGGAEREDTARVDERALIERLAARLPANGAPVRLRRVTLTDGRVRQAGRGPGLDAIASGITLEADDLWLDANAAADTTRTLFTERMAVGIRSFRRITADSLYELSGGPVRLSTADGRLEIDTIRFVTTVDGAAFRRRVPHRMTRYAIEITGIESSGLQSRPLLHTTGLRTAAVDIAALDADILLDKRLPRGPLGRVLLPNEAVRELDRVIGIDTLRLHEGRIVYGEVAPDGVRPGRIAFDDIAAELRDFSNDGADGGAGSPATLKARATVAGQGPLEVTLRIPLLSPTLDLDLEGGMGPLRAPALNPMFENLDGISIRSGEVREIRFAAETRAGTSRGTLTAVYDDLSVARIDKGDGGQSVGKWIESFIANAFIVRGSNLPEDGTLPHRGTISHTRDSDEPFLAFIWASLRSGILSQIGID